MARRHSLQNQPASHAPGSVNGPVVNANEETSPERAGDNKGRKRSTSFTGFFTKLLPSHRPERRGTLRDQGFWEQHKSRQSDHPVSERRPPISNRHGSDSIASNGWNPAMPLPQRSESILHHGQKRPSPARVQSNPVGNHPKSLIPRRQRVAGQHDTEQDGQPMNITKETTHTEAEVTSSTFARQPRDNEGPTQTVIGRLVTTFDTKREARRLRRSLKESGDFLGVQGINPQTGVMDVLTPTSSSPTDRTMMSAPEPKGCSESMSDFRAAYKRSARTLDAEEASLERLRQEQERLDKIQRKKDSIRAFQQRVRWRKDKTQWSSVAEPDLSPIADASTRSRTPRATSDGGIVPPPAIPKVLHWEEQQQRSVSTPAGVQTAASTSQHSRPSIVAQQSSDTVIHTPHPTADRRYSIVPDIFGNGPLSPVGSSSAAARRATEPSAVPALGSPVSSRSDRIPSGKLFPPPKDKLKPSPLKITIPTTASQNFTPFPMNDQESFLGTRFKPGQSNGHHIRDQAIITPATPMGINQNENNLLGGPPDMDTTPTGSPLNVAVRDFGREMTRKVWFVAHPSPTKSPPRQSRSVDQGQLTNGATATSSPSPQRYRHRRQEPLIPLRQGSSQKDTGLTPEPEIEDINSVDLIDIGTPLEVKHSSWAEQLMDDMASFGLDRTRVSTPRPRPGQSDEEISPRTKTVAPVWVPEREPEPVPEPAIIPTQPAKPTPQEMKMRAPPRSASTPTTTITGYDHRLVAHTRGLHRKPPRFDGPAADSVAHKEDRVIRISAMEAATKLQLEERARQESYDMSGDGRATRISTMEVTEDEAEGTTGTDQQQQPLPLMTPALTSAQRQTQPAFDLLASPPRLPPSVWPSLDIAGPLQHQMGKQQQHRKPVATDGQQARRATEPAVVMNTEMVLYVPGQGLANGTMSSHGQTSSLPTTETLKEEGHHHQLSVPAKTATALMYAQEEQQQDQDQEQNQAAPPAITTPTTSAPQRAATRDRCERLYRRVSRRLPNSKAGPMTLPPANAANASSSHTCTSTYQQVKKKVQMPKYAYMPAHPSAGSSSSSSLSSSPSPVSSQQSSSSSPERKEKAHQIVVHKHRHRRDEATEAARTALVGTHCSAARGRIVQVYSSRGKGKGTGSSTNSNSNSNSKSPTSTTTAETTETAGTAGVLGLDDAGTAQEQGQRGSSKRKSQEKEMVSLVGGGAGDIAGPSSRGGGGSGREHHHHHGGAKRVPLKDPFPGDTRTSQKPSRAEEIVAHLLRGYWELIVPVFDAGSPISKRYSAGMSTWHDCLVYLLALVFVLVAFLAAVWGVKGMLLVGRLARAVVWGCLILVGF